jgi:hypothetical protein
MPVSCQADPQTGADAANDLALMAIHCVGVGYPGAISLGRRRVPVSIRRHRQIHQIAGSDPMVKINKQSIVKFIKFIICRFGVPNRIITDNGS